ncbi:UNVERIFIED_CONTAM: hypothetical protein K2H54_061851 [Gekko kuhli]
MCFTQRDRRQMLLSLLCNGRIPKAEKSMCQTAVISAAVWTAGDPLRIIVTLGVTNNTHTNAGASLTLTDPLGDTQEFSPFQWKTESWSIDAPKDPLQGPPDWIIQLGNTTCHPDYTDCTFEVRGTLIIDTMHKKGNYTLTIIHENITTVVIDPLIRRVDSLRNLTYPVVGSHILKHNQPEQVLEDLQVRASNSVQRPEPRVEHEPRTLAGGYWCQVVIPNYRGVTREQKQDSKNDPVGPLDV